MRQHNDAKDTGSAASDIELQSRRHAHEARLGSTVARQSVYAGNKHNHDSTVMRPFRQMIQVCIWQCFMQNCWDLTIPSKILPNASEGSPCSKYCPKPVLQPACWHTNGIGGGLAACWTDVMAGQVLAGQSFPYTTNCMQSK